MAGLLKVTTHCSRPFFMRRSSFATGAVLQLAGSLAWLTSLTRACRARSVIGGREGRSKSGSGCAKAGEASAERPMAAAIASLFIDILLKIIALAVPAGT